jgi:peptidyl-prolyl cis-trans isomerase D
VLDDYRNEQLPALLNQKTKELSDKAQASKDLAKAAKEAGATVKTSDLVGQSGQVPDFGQVEQVAPQLFDMSVGAISGPINTGRTGVVARLVDKQEPTDAEIQQNFDRARDQIRDQRQNEAFQLFASNVVANYKKSNRVRINPKAAAPETGE